MKKLLFLCLLIVASSQLKAQSIQIQPYNNFHLKPFNKLPDSLKLATPQYQQLAASNFKVNTSVISYSTYDHMPIVRMDGNSKMPIIKMPGNSKMPVIDLDAHIINMHPGQLPGKP